MKAPILLAAIILSALALVTACGDDGPTEEEIQQGLQLMVLQPTEIPEGLQNIRGEFADNDAAASGLGGGASKKQLDDWGRILGYAADFQTADPNPVTFVNALSTQVTLYEEADGASDSFTDRVARARTADWEASTDLTEFQQEELTRELPVDDSYWIHLTGFQGTSSTERRLVSNDIAIFRIGRAWGYLNVVSLAAAAVSDRAFAESNVEELLLKQIEHTRNTLDSGLLD